METFGTCRPVRRRRLYLILPVFLFALMSAPSFASLLLPHGATTHARHNTPVQKPKSPKQKDPKGHTRTPTQTNTTPNTGDKPVPEPPQVFDGH